MNNPALSFRAPLSQPTLGWRRYVGISLAVLFNGILVWALANGLNIRVATYIPNVGFTKIIDEQPQAHEIPPPPDPRIPRTLRTEPTPRTPIASDPDARTITAPPQQQSQTTPDIADSSVVAVTGTHTSPPYPPVARRLDQQGTVILSIAVAADGSVSAAQVATSSGVPELDQAALDWVKSHWRYKPAMQGGVAVPSTTQAAVKFDLKQAR